jgi:hypothetical protein
VTHHQQPPIILFWYEAECKYGRALPVTEMPGEATPQCRSGFSIAQAPSSCTRNTPLVFSAYQRVQTQHYKNFRFSDHPPTPHRSENTAPLQYDIPFFAPSPVRHAGIAPA